MKPFKILFFTPHIDFPKKHNLLDKIKYLFFSRMTVSGYEKFHKVTPEELGLRK
jgi:hypothetical protein